MCMERPRLIEIADSAALTNALVWSANKLKDSFQQSNRNSISAALESIGCTDSQKH